MEARLFQSACTEKIIRVIQAGFTLGMTIFVNTVHSLAPSIFAASISAEGRPSMNCFIRNRPMGDAKAGTMMAQ